MDTSFVSRSLRQATLTGNGLEPHSNDHFDRFTSLHRKEKFLFALANFLQESLHGNDAFRKR
jgi:hypothetical protein